MSNTIRTPRAFPGSPCAPVRRGDIFYADLSPVVGSEQGGLRPVLIIQNDVGNRYSPTVIAAAITSRMGKTRLPTHIDVAADKTADPATDRLGLARDSVILLEQIRTLDKRRLRERMGHLDDAVMAEVNNAIAVSFGLHEGVREDGSLSDRRPLRRDAEGSGRGPSRYGEPAAAASVGRAAGAPGIRLPANGNAAASVGKETAASSAAPAHPGGTAGGMTAASAVTHAVTSATAHAMTSAEASSAETAGTSGGTSSGRAAGGDAVG